MMGAQNFGLNRAKSSTNGGEVICVLLSVCVRRVWDIPTLHFANWTVIRISASSRMCIEVKIALRVISEAALRDTAPRVDST